MTHWIGPVLYIALMAFLPLIYVSLKTISPAKLRDKTFVILMVKDFIRTVPICGLMCLPFLIYPPITPVYLILVQIVFMPLMFMEVGHVYLFGTRIGLNTFYTVFVSNIRETREYIGQNIPKVLYGLAAVFLVGPLVWIGTMPLPAYTGPVPHVLCVGVAVAIATPFMLNLPRKWPRFKDGYILNPFSNIFYHYYQYRKNYQALKAHIAANRAPAFAPILSRLPPDVPETYLIVIGESANRMHFSCYGYPRNTNEYTAAFGDEMMYFDHVRSPFAQTMPSLERTLSFADAAHPTYLTDKGNIIDYFKQAGFKTYWLSNQYALEDTVITAMTTHADYNKCYNFGGMKRFEKAGLDGDLLPDIRRFIADTTVLKKVIFVHLIGSHSAYTNRYPSEFTCFTDTMPGRHLSPAGYQLLNAYDDSIRYTDYVIAEMIRALKQQNGASYLLYFSDHGEDIYDSTDTRILGHSELANEPMTSVPFMVWISQTLHHLRPDLSVRARHPADSYNLEQAIHTILDLSSLTNDDFDVCQSILAPPETQ